MISSSNEWDKLREVIVGSAWGSHWPKHDPVFSRESELTSWIDAPVPSGPVPSWIVDEANQDLEVFCKLLIDAGVRVHRPEPQDFSLTDGMYNYCPRDRVLVADTTVVDVAMMYPCRDQEIHNLHRFLLTAPLITMPRDQGLCLDAANVCRLNDDWLVLRSRSGNDAAITWLQETFPHKRIHACDFYQGVHIDSTILALREGVVMLNASRVNEHNLPSVLKNWDKIWVDDIQSREFHHYPYCSAWVGMNVFSIDARTVIMDSIQVPLARQLEAHGFDVILTPMRHCRTLGGGPHCVTLDLWREHG
jgi:glycine amidinotransferase